MVNGAAHRGVVQLVECRSPKPEVVGSSPAAPANTWVCKPVTVAGPARKAGSIWIRVLTYENPRKYALSNG